MITSPAPRATLHIADAARLLVPVASPSNLLVISLQSPSNLHMADAARLLVPVASLSRAHSHVPPPLRGHRVGDVGPYSDRCGGGRARSPLVQ
jgi:hypothetical protein